MERRSFSLSLRERAGVREPCWQTLHSAIENVDRCETEAASKAALPHPACGHLLPGGEGFTWTRCYFGATGFLVGFCFGVLGGLFLAGFFARGFTGSTISSSPSVNGASGGARISASGPIGTAGG